MTHPPSSKTQAERFAEAARELGLDETGEAFERAMARIFPPREAGKPAPRLVETAHPKGSRRKDETPK
jgi:hypothetical protein